MPWIRLSIKSFGRLHWIPIAYCLCYSVFRSLSEFEWVMDKRSREEHLTFGSNLEFSLWIFDFIFIFLLLLHQTDSDQQNNAFAHKRKREKPVCCWSRHAIESIESEARKWALWCHWRLLKFRFFKENFSQWNGNYNLVVVPTYQSIQQKNCIYFFEEERKMTWNYRKRNSFIQRKVTRIPVLWWIMKCAFSFRRRMKSLEWFDERIVIFSRTIQIKIAQDFRIKMDFSFWHTFYLKNIMNSHYINCGAHMELFIFQWPKIRSERNLEQLSIFPYIIMLIE